MRESGFSVEDFHLPTASLAVQEVQNREIEESRILQKGDLQTNYEAQPGDVITVPERAF